ncbi:MAG: BCCT family transporter, partial [Pseudomonadota bacterium]
MQGDRTLLGVSLAFIAGFGLWGVADPAGLDRVASAVVNQYFVSRGWFVMLSVSGMLILCFALAFSRYGDIR